MSSFHRRRSPARRPRGFTLVELLIVIVIVAMLMALLLGGVIVVKAKAERAQITSEIIQLSAGMQSYKDEHSSFPPSFAAYDASGGVADAHEVQIMRHLRVAFPQYIRDTDGNGVQNYDDFQDDVATATTDTTFSSGRDTDDLDQAEALAFWLGGLPSLTTESKLMGFSLNPQNPFENDTVQPQRTKRLFEFQTERLVDLDSDGWWEYLPPGAPPTGEMAPYVYFDAATYTASTAPTPAILLASYPSTVGGAPRGPAAQAITWGASWPLWRVAPGTGSPPDPPAQWVNSDSFQILCAGLDGAYSQGSPAPTEPTIFPPVGVAVLPPGDQQLDNLASFTEGTLEDESLEHAQ